MTIAFFILGICQALFLWYLGQCGKRLAERAREESGKTLFEPANGWPRCSLIIPVAGSHPNMEKALESLCSQNYPFYEVVLVTAKGDAHAGGLVAAFANIFPRVRVALAEEAGLCGQKNQNLLTGVKAASPETQVYAFCDSSHYAPPDFLRCLVLPLANGESAFSTGYHQVEPRDTGIATIGYAMTVLFMRFLQGMSGLTQLWGGAMAMTASAFYHYRVAGLWAENVVDDCSLSARLARLGVKIRLAPAALLVTPAGNHSFSVWAAWLKRQILFLKFCMPGQWVALGFVSLFMAIPPAWAVWTFCMGISGFSGGVAPFLALCWLCFLAWALLSWRGYFSLSIPVSHWLLSFFSAMAMFFMVYVETIFTRMLLWHKKFYDVGENGRVLKITQKN